ncbi:MAG: hypothetical protein Ct9H90mP13_04270 [Pseudomonadota bacterium]|nr:MAG: hypothetical protein Ct9H90mP13_04270 [Pseudomonadota bacterium]
MRYTRLDFLKSNESGNEMNKIIERVGWEGTFDEFLNFLRTDPQFYFETGEELLQAYLATSKKLDPKIVPLFKGVSQKCLLEFKPKTNRIAPIPKTAFLYEAFSRWVSSRFLLCESL